MICDTLTNWLHILGHTCGQSHQTFSVPFRGQEGENTLEKYIFKLEVPMHDLQCDPVQYFPFTSILATNAGKSFILVSRLSCNII